MNFSGIMANARMPTTEKELYVGNNIVTPILPLACHPDPIKNTKMAKMNFMREMNPARIAGYQAIMDFFAAFPFGASAPAFYLLSTKTTSIITSIPSTFDLSLKGDIVIEGICGMTARISATRSQVAVAPAGPNFCVSLGTETNRMKEPERFRAIFVQKFNEFLAGNCSPNRNAVNEQAPPVQSRL